MNLILLKGKLKKGNWRGLLIYFGLILLFACVLYIPIIIVFPNIQIREEYDRLYETYSFRFAIEFVFLVAAILATYNMCKNYDKRDLKSLLLTLSIRNALLGFLIGTVIMSVFAVLSFSFGFIDFRFSGITSNFLWGFIFYLIVSLTEEILFRGYVLANLRDRYNTESALIISSIMFGLIHLGNDNVTVIGFATISLCGFLMGCVALMTKTISVAIGLHWSWNFIQGTVLGLSVSGVHESGVFAPQLLSDEVLTGGNFGAEGSILTLILSAISIFAITRYSSFFGRLFNPGMVS